VAPCCSITSGATEIDCVLSLWTIGIKSALTPIRTPNNGAIAHLSCGNTEISQLDTTIFVCEDVGAFDVAVYNTLVMQINKPVQNLRDVDRDETLRELAKAFADIVQRAILAIPIHEMRRSIEDKKQHTLG
jgi:hypothetical protein